MQKASDKYIESMKLPFRNRSYIRGSIGIINSEAQKTAKFSDDTEFTAFSNGNDVFTKRAAKAIYATAEQDFSRVDGSMLLKVNDVKTMHFIYVIIKDALEDLDG